MQKKFGQNFLIDDHILEQILDAAEIGPEDVVVEVGPGIGTLTERLCERAKQVLAVEIDSNLIPILEETLSPFQNKTILNADILKIDVKEEVNKICKDAEIKVVANLPYYITTPIVMGLLEGEVPLSSITIMIQKEVADRMRVGPGTKDYGALSLAVQYFSEPKITANVPPNCFMPRPTVGSAVLNLRCFGGVKPVRPKDEKLMFALIKAAFGQRRKTLVNSLEHGTSFGLGKEDIRSAIVRLGIPENTRGEELSLSQFAELSDIIHSHMETITIGQSGTD
jgi:16S rRNA (adenine1518-N6/adenine1519-N6)-dimethyltransferase